MREPSDPRNKELELARFRFIAKTMDETFKIPILRLKFGLDGILGFIPLFGDILGFLISAYLLSTAYRLKAPNVVLSRMFANMAIDLFAGIIPVFGDVFDVAWKANMKNLKLLESHVAEPEQAERSSYLFFFALLLLHATLAAGVIWFAAQAIGFIASMLSGGSAS